MDASRSTDDSPVAAPALAPSPGRGRSRDSPDRSIQSWALPPTVLLVIGGLSNQIGAALATSLFTGTGAVGAAALRLVCAGAMLLIWCRPSLRMPFSTALLVVVYGAVIGSGNLMFYSAVARLPLGVAATIEFLGPLVVAFLNCRRRTHMFAVMLAGAGVALISWTSGAMDWAGVCYALAAGLGWACYVVLSPMVGSRLRGSNGLALGITIGGLCVLPFGLASAGWALLRLPTLAIGAAIALLSSALPYSLEFSSLQRVPKRVYGVLVSLEPAMAAIAGLVLLHQQLSLVEWGGLAAVVAASIMISVADRTDVTSAQPAKPTTS